MRTRRVQRGRRRATAVGLALVLAGIAAPGWSGPADGDAGPGLVLSPPRTLPGATVTLAEDTTFDMLCGTDGEERTATWELVQVPGIAEVPSDPDLLDQPPLYTTDAAGTVVDEGSVEVTSAGPWSTEVTLPADAPPGTAFFARGECLDVEGGLLFGYYWAFGTIAGAPIHVIATTTTAGPTPGPPPAVAATGADPISTAPSYAG